MQKGGVEKNEIDFNMPSNKSSHIPNNSKQRESNFELLRLLAMFSIVLYHLLGIYWNDSDAHQYVMFDALTVPFHFGVPVFVLISGYFGIRISWRGILKLLVPVFIYYVPIELTMTHLRGGGPSDYFNKFLFLSQTPYWFVQTYFWLFLVSPAINLYMKDATLKKRLWVLFALAFITMYVGTIGNDLSLAEGKNVLYFSLLYIIGNTLHQYKSYWERLLWRWLLTIVLLLNIGLVLIYFVFCSIPTKLFFPYNSVGMLLNSILIFILFGHLNIKSQFINYLASSAFIIYLVHGEPTLCQLQMNYVGQIYHHVGYGISFYFALAGFSLLVMIISIGIDKLICPIYNHFILSVLRKYNIE